MSSQRSLAQALGIDAALVSRYQARGMPTDNVAAARAWRQKNIAPYARMTTRSPEARGQQEKVDDLAVMTGEESVAVVAALSVTAAARIDAGQTLGDLELPLRAALRSVPLLRAKEVQLPRPVWDALCADAIAALGTLDNCEAERERFKADATEVEAMGEFWFKAAAGLVRAREAMGPRQT
ncbi:MAG: hypothetical protein IPL57_01975 [Rubrivivax sp.]|nr:hypothetical protein [Rubrivivax sp.]